MRHRKISGHSPRWRKAVLAADQLCVIGGEEKIEEIKKKIRDLKLKQKMTLGVWNGTIYREK